MVSPFIYFAFADKEPCSVSHALAELALSPSKGTVVPYKREKPQSLPEPEGYDDVLEHLASCGTGALVPAALQILWSTHTCLLYLVSRRHLPLCLDRLHT